MNTGSGGKLAKRVLRIARPLGGPFSGRAASGVKTLQVLINKPHGTRTVTSYKDKWTWVPVVVIRLIILIIFYSIQLEY